MNEFPLVSILIPLYNAEQYFPETMESLLAQIYTNLEIIIVNDGSTDNSLKIAREYEKQHSHIKVYTQNNCGAQVARNKAFEMSKGEYIQYFDADDIMHSNKIESQMEVLRQYDIQNNIVSTGRWMTFIGALEKAVPEKQVIAKSYNDKFHFFKESWENVETIIGPSWLISRSLHESVGRWDIRLKKNQDGEFFTRVAYHANKIVFVEESIVYYRKGIADSISSNPSSHSVRSELDSYHMYYELVKNDLDKYSLHEAVAILYSSFYKTYFPFPLNKEMKEEIREKLKSLGYNHPIIMFNSKVLQIVKFFGIDIALYLGKVKSKLVTIVRKN